MIQVTVDMETTTTPQVEAEVVETVDMEITVTEYDIVVEVCDE